MNIFTLPMQLTLFPALQREILVMGTVLRPSACDIHVSAQPHLSLDKSSVGERGESQTQQQGLCQARSRGAWGCHHG